MQTAHLIDDPEWLNAPIGPGLQRDADRLVAIDDELRALGLHASEAPEHLSRERGAVLERIAREAVAAIATARAAGA